jgi:hypothetical protein
MFDEDLMHHIIKYIEDYPDDIRLDDYREDTRILVSGRLNERSSSPFSTRNNDFTLSFNYDKEGKLKNVNGIDFAFDTTPLTLAFKKAIARNFKLKRKIDKIKKGKR